MVSGKAPIQLVKTAFVVYYHTDLHQQQQFLLDFGLTVVQERKGEVFLGGFGTEPYAYVLRQSQTSSSYFGGAAYVVESHEELERARDEFGGSAITPLDGPGGGEMVTLTDPFGNHVHLVHGWKEKPMQMPELPKLVLNYEDEKPRRGKFQRFELGPAPVYRWGHYGLSYPMGQYEEMYNWYTQTLTLAPSDIIMNGDTPVVCFFHIDRGLEFTDHHCFFMKPGKPEEQYAVAHSAFEIHDYDIQQLGHEFLASKGYELCWGVGRHVLGSQIFDYWFDKAKFVVEHYADGDLVNSETAVAHTPFGPQALHIWGPPVPEVF
ncbi:Glyoxalase/Bleomycin resistance protein/Dihydroxybiphenyl dioxygenase [Neofusicoccum parvum]|uniref:Glyoxalase/Bleomycin resistance protein/Dihydroxybiphenyl dioxygenase n=1 Tax=Neofusicoccum parvum TaxID=310453 RepID=A0ACB5S999_9PEZI|nr:Glyoxalase/Bleomycin resistance protein/Dihydroxybiphenyl dioxygenase [Neofusicoccum parvum]